MMTDTFFKCVSHSPSFTTISTPCYFFLRSVARYRVSSTHQEQQQQFLCFFSLPHGFFLPGFTMFWKLKGCPCVTTLLYCRTHSHTRTQTRTLSRMSAGVFRVLLGLLFLSLSLSLGSFFIFRWHLKLVYSTRRDWECPWAVVVVFLLWETVG